MIIYKFFQWHGNDFTYDVFLEHSLFFGSHLNFNDPFDCNPLGTFDGPKVVEQIKSMSYIEQIIIKSLCLQYGDNPSEYFFEANKDNIERHGICCFSKKWDNNLMWAHYADRHKGICIGFDTDLLKDEDIEFYPINYVKEQLKVNVPCSDDDIIRILTTKGKDWKYEKEIRAIKKFPTKKLTTKDRIWKFNSHAVKEIILGAKMNERDTRLLFSICKRDDFSNAIPYKIVYDETKNFGLGRKNLLE